MTSTREILQALASGEISINEAEKALRMHALGEVGNIGMLDGNRHERSGVPEVVFAETKAIDYLISITKVMVEKNDVVLLTRMNHEKLEAVKSAYPDLIHEVSGKEDHLTVLVHTKDWSDPPSRGKIAIMTAGTSDITYAYEAVAVARLMGVKAFT
ncbi:MAG: hypothetical protein E3J86_06180, partial [Candidatus Thorarchaeota archaeon]